MSASNSSRACIGTARWFRIGWACCCCSSFKTPRRSEHAFRDAFAFVVLIVGGMLVAMHYFRRSALREWEKHSNDK